MGGPPFELLAIDDGSRDGGPAVVRALAATDARVRPFATPGLGIALALREGLRHARGAFIARMDGDDVSHPDRLRIQIAAMMNQPRLGALGTRVRVFPDEMVAEGMRRYVEWQNGLLSPEAHRQALFIESPLCHPSTMLRRSALEAVGPWRDLEGPEDYDLWLRLDQAGWQLGKCPEVLLDWRRGRRNATVVDARYHKHRFLPLKVPFLAERVRAVGLPLVVWGAGPTGKRTARALEALGLAARFFVDIEGGRVGRLARGRPVFAARALRPGHHFVVVAVAARGARDLIRSELSAAGFVEGADFLCAA